jgi:hypothetical protein
VVSGGNGPKKLTRVLSKKTEINRIRHGLTRCGNEAEANLGSGQSKNSFVRRIQIRETWATHSSLEVTVCFSIEPNQIAASFREPPNAEGDREPYQDHVYQQPLHETMVLIGTPGVECGKRQNDKLHHQVHCDPIEQSAD